MEGTVACVKYCVIITILFEINICDSLKKPICISGNLATEVSPLITELGLRFRNVTHYNA
jgi:hypothetical protein